MTQTYILLMTLWVMFCLCVGNFIGWLTDPRKIVYMIYETIISLASVNRRVSDVQVATMEFLMKASKQ